MIGSTPLKFNIAPEKNPFEKVTFQGYVSFREGMVLYSCPVIFRERFGASGMMYFATFNAFLEPQKPQNHGVGIAYFQLPPCWCFFDFLKFLVFPHTISMAYQSCSTNTTYNQTTLTANTLHSRLLTRLYIYRGLYYGSSSYVEIIINHYKDPY